MIKKCVIVIGLIISIVSATETSINAKRGKYQLNFDCTYTLPVCRGIQTMIELPMGYTYTGTVIGAGYYVSVSELQNAMYITKLAEEKFETNIVFHVVTPEGFEKKLLFSVFGSPRSKAVYAVQFEQPNVSEINTIVREIKSQYDEQLMSTLADQERQLKSSVYEKTISDIRPLQIKQRRRGKKVVSHKGVTGFVDGIYNSGGSTYVRIISDVPYDRNCLKFRLVSISRKETKVECDLFDVFEDEKGNTVYIFETVEISPVQRKKFTRYKNLRYRFHYKIWDENVKQKLRIS